MPYYVYSVTRPHKHHILLFQLTLFTANPLFSPLFSSFTPSLFSTNTLSPFPSFLVLSLSCFCEHARDYAKAPLNFPHKSSCCGGKSISVVCTLDTYTPCHHFFPLDPVFSFYYFGLTLSIGVMKSKLKFRFYSRVFERKTVEESALEVGKNTLMKKHEAAFIIVVIF